MHTIPEALRRVRLRCPCNGRTRPRFPACYGLWRTSQKQYENAVRGCRRAVASISSSRRTCAGRRPEQGLRRALPAELGSRERRHPTEQQREIVAQAARLVLDVLDAVAVAERRAACRALHRIVDASEPVDQPALARLGARPHATLRDFVDLLRGRLAAFGHQRQEITIVAADHLRDHLLQPLVERPGEVGGLAEPRRRDARRS